MRISIEKCLAHVTNCFELVLVSAMRARSISAGATVTIANDNNKPTVIALKEIAENTYPAGKLKESLISSMQRYHSIMENICEEEIS